MQSRHRTTMASFLHPNSLLPRSPPYFQSRDFPRFFSGFQARTQSRLGSVPVSRAEVQKEEIVIIGAGIAGLATAVSLQRLGIGSVVLEQAESLRTGGTSLTLFKNGWRVLDAIGVGNDLRSQFLEIQGMVVKAEDGRELRSFVFREEDQRYQFQSHLESQLIWNRTLITRNKHTYAIAINLESSIVSSQEVRAVERRVLLATLAEQLPRNAVQFSSKLAKIEANGNGETLLELTNGTRLLAKIVIGCDGTRSSVAKWMGFSEPKYVGHCAFRGLGFYPNGQPFEPRVNYVYGKGLRAGYVPVSPTKVYWFVCYNSESPGPKITDPVLLKNQAKELVRNLPAELRSIIDITPDETISKTPLVDRWLWPALSPPASSGNVVLVGDAWHPMTPNLGQGACCALEDAVTLARKLGDAIRAGPESVDGALRTYGSERWPRVFPLTVRASLVGSLLQWDNPVVCAVRDNFVVPKLVRLGPVLEHTNFECEPLIAKT